MAMTRIILFILYDSYNMSHILQVTLNLQNWKMINFLIPVSNFDGLAESPVRHLKIAENPEIFKLLTLTDP